MKKKTLSNLLMVLIIVVVAVGGIMVALQQKKPQDTGLGSQYHISEIENNTLLVPGEENSCTITIVCGTILENLDRFEEAKIPYVPVDAVILPKITVSFSDGDTVFQVLQKVCTAADVQLEYNWTPLYNSYYIEGINHIYEFDCGFESGWMYKVNELFPNYGCSAYEVKDGDEIVWCYTCVGQGTDVGGVWTGE